MSTRERFLSMTGVALGMGLIAGPVAAQDYSPYVTPGFGYRITQPEVVIVRPPPQRKAPQIGELGVPIQNVSLSRKVRYDDLDLTSDWGVRALRSRIEATARELCNRLDIQYPVSADSGGGGWPVDMRCYRRTVDGAMDQVTEVVREARTNNDNESESEP